MGGVVPPLPQYAFMAWCSGRRSRGTTLPLPLPQYDRCRPTFDRRASRDLTWPLVVLRNNFTREYMVCTCHIMNLEEYIIRFEEYMELEFSFS
jgi:hypothetical protein